MKLAFSKDFPSCSMEKAVERHTSDIKTSDKATVVIQGREKGGTVDRKRYIKVVEMTLYPGIQKSRKTSNLPRVAHCFSLERLTEDGGL